MNLSIQNLSKTYSNGVRALRDVSLTIPNGMFGLLGPNGAGKSSLMRTIATLQEPDSGSIMLGDINVLTEKDAVRRVLGYLPQEFGLYPSISAEVLLDYFAGLKGIRDGAERKQAVESLLQQTNLWSARKKAVGAIPAACGSASALRWRCWARRSSSSSMSRPLASTLRSATGF